VRQDAVAEDHAHWESLSQLSCVVWRYAQRRTHPAEVVVGWHIGEAAHSIWFDANSEHF